MAQANEKRTVRGGVVHTIRRRGRTGLRSWLRVLLSGAIIIVLGPFEFLQALPAFEYLILDHILILRFGGCQNMRI